MHYTKPPPPRMDLFGPPTNCSAGHSAWYFHMRRPVHGACGAIFIAQCCLKLESLELENRWEVTEEMAVSLCQHGLKGLQRLTLPHPPATPKAILHFHSETLKLVSFSLFILLSS